MDFTPIKSRKSRRKSGDRRKPKRYHRHNKPERSNQDLETLKQWRKRVTLLEEKYNDLLRHIKSREIVRGRFVYIKRPAKCTNPAEIYNIEGIYLLYNRDELVYIGYSTCITTRIGTHYKDKDKIFTNYDVLVLDDLESDEYLQKEKDLIQLHKPKYNIQHA